MDSPCSRPLVKVLALPAVDGRNRKSDFPKAGRRSTFSLRSDDWQEAGLKQQEVAKMRIELRPADVRRLILSVLRDLGTPTSSLFDLEENVVIDRGRSIGRSYRVDQYMAMWLADIGLIQFYDCDGNMLRTINLFEELSPHRMAA
jgi:hypothetical protein